MTLRPLAKQAVDKTDSVLGPHRYWTGKGLKSTYAYYIRKAFRPEYWSGGSEQMARNFSFYWGLSVMLYEQTLVSDDAPYDRFAEGNSSALTAQQKEGLSVFLGKGKCIACHRGPEFTAAGTELLKAHREGGLVEQMVMGDGGVALYDSGFYNIGARPTAEDIGLGGTDPFGNPLSFTRQELIRAAGGEVFDPFSTNPASFEVNNGVTVSPDAEESVDGSFKTPGLRNIELTGPYFHHGGYATLEQVVEFYNRGGDRRGNSASDTTGFGANGSNLDPDIQQLNLSASEQAALVAFLRSLTDERVRWERAPFDHPQLFIPDGHVGNEHSVRNDGTGDAVDSLRAIPAVGAAGRAPKLLPPLKPFLAD
jgi:cytochrome c peroxidase